MNGIATVRVAFAYSLLNFGASKKGKFMTYSRLQECNLEKILSSWFYELAGIRKGPVSQDEIVNLYETGAISLNTLVWNPEFGNLWKSLADSLIVTSTKNPPPLPTSQLNNVYAWILTLIPLVGSIIGILVSGSFTPTFLQESIFYFFVNSIISLKDVANIENSGQNPNKVLLKRWFFIVPIYLFQRSRALGHKQYYLILWIASTATGAYIENPNMLDEPTYWGSGIPSCDSSVENHLVKNIFEKIPINKYNALSAVKVIDPLELNNKDGIRYCTAKILADDGKTYGVLYNITKNKNEFYTRLKMSQ